MKAASQDNASSPNAEVKTAELTILLDGLRVDTSVLNQAHEAMGESSRAGLPEGIRARLRMRNNVEPLRTMIRAPNLRVSLLLILK